MKVPAQPIDPRDAAFIVPATSSSWGEPLLAALPHLWVGISVAIDKISSSNPSSLFLDLGTIALIVFLIACLGVVAYAWRHAWPLWTASWLGYAAWILVILAGLLTYRLSNGNWIISVLLIFGALGGIALAYLLIFRSSRPYALLLALFLMPVATQLGLEAIPDSLEAFIGLFFGLLAAGVAAIVVNTNSWRAGSVLAIAANLLSGAALTYIAFYQAEIPNFYGDSLIEAAGAFLVYAGLAVLLFLGPPVFWAIWGRLASTISPPSGQERRP